MVGISDCLRLMMQCLRVLMLLLFVAIKTNISEACITVRRHTLELRLRSDPGIPAGLVLHQLVRGR